MLKRFMPKRLFGRALLIVAAPLLILQAVVAYLVVDRHWYGFTRQMTEAVGQELTFLAELIEETDDRDAVFAMMRRISSELGYGLWFSRGDKLPLPAPSAFFHITDRALIDEMHARIPYPVSIDAISERKIVMVRIELADGVLTARVPERRLVASKPHLLLAWTGFSGLTLLLVAVIFLRNQIRPIGALARAAEAFGMGRSARFSVSGAAEVRQAAIAFLQMRTRIERHVEQRTAMLAAVSHDLRTPLTRLRLSLEFLDADDEIEAMRRDVAAMERMIEGYLDFARGQSAAPSEMVDLEALLREVAAEAERGGRGAMVRVEIESEPGPGGSANSVAAPLQVLARRDALRRCVENLLGNALRHGETVSLCLRAGPRAIEIAVEDDGPGIPQELREEAFKPFTRLDAARNQDADARKGGRSAGVGLGLAIARDIARAHGGDIRLSERAGGGLRATIHLPRALMSQDGDG